MWTTGSAWYKNVGEDAVRVICASLAAAKTREVRKVLDFGCAYGRVGRHLRCVFPEASLLFCDLNTEGAQFCADKFGGRNAPAEQLPSDLDLVWVGSVFTHIPYERALQLFNLLFSTLAPHGLLIATFHGRRAIFMHSKHPYIAHEKWEGILCAYRATGAGYASYALERLDYLGDYGVSLTTAAAVISLAEQAPEARLISYHEAGWANHQDVAVWTRYGVTG
jgi:SAM-dependent methyltransferase